MTIRKRIKYSSAIVLSLIITMMAMNWFGNHEVIRKNDTAYYLSHTNMCLQGIFRGLNEFIIDEGEPLSIELTKKHINMFDTYHDLLLNQANAEHAEVLDEKITSLWTVFRKDVLSFMKNNPYISVDDDQAMLSYGQIIGKANTLLTDVNELSEQAQKDSKLTTQKTKNTINIVAGSILAIICFLLVNLYRAITTPIKELTEMAAVFGDGNLDVTLNDRRKDEFGKLASHFNKAIWKLSRMISNIKNSSDTVSASSEKLYSLASQIATNTSEQLDQADQASSAIEEMNSSFLNVTRDSSAAAESSQEASGLAQQGGTIVSGTIEGMNKISLAVNDSASIVEELGNRSEQIGEIIQVINDIAGQTNLLALNAAIEAARAGEQGRGFAVVADEVKKLAERTAAATNEISEMIRGIQEDTTRAVHSMQSGRNEVEAGMQLASEAGDALQRIVTSVQNVSDMVQQIAAASEEQSQTSNAISLNVASVAELTRQTSSSAHQSSESSQILNTLAKKLNHLTGGFRLHVNAGGVDREEAEPPLNISPHLPIEAENQKG